MTPRSTLLVLGLLALSILHAEGAASSRSQALFEEAQSLTNMLEVGAKLREARDAGKGSLDGSRAALELARLEYAQDRSDATLSILHSADDWPRDPDLDGQWLYLRAQARVLGKGFQRARDDFQQLISAHPQHRLAPAAQLGLADCESLLRHDERALQAYQAIIDGRGPFTAQALWGSADLLEAQNKDAEALAYFQHLAADYPASFEAAAARDRITRLEHKKPKHALRPTPTPKPSAKAYFLRVGLYSRIGLAQHLAKILKRNHYKVQVKKLQVAGRDMVLVRTGPYRKLTQAEADARRLKAQDKQDSMIEEE